MLHPTPPGYAVSGEHVRERAGAGGARERESETRLALVTLGLDPGIGFLHPARAYRDSLALDVMEAVRPEVERWLYQWVTTEHLRRADFHETGSGNCRLMSSLCSKLSETAPTWGKLGCSVGRVCRTDTLIGHSGEAGCRYSPHSAK
jgi:hypothetical protein